MKRKLATYTNMFCAHTQKLTYKLSFSALAFFLACALALPVTFAHTNFAYADVRRADIIYGESVESRELSVNDCPDISAEYACVMDESGKIYFERNASSAANIASITKVMTAIVATDIAPLELEVTVNEDAASIGESTAGLAAGDVLNLDQALYALLVPSGNDASLAIALSVGSYLIDASQNSKKLPSYINPNDYASLDAQNNDDALSAFVDAMNKCADSLGCTNTVYTNPHGLDDEGYEGNLHSSASDQALIAKRALQNEKIAAIVSGGSCEISLNRAGETISIYLETTDALLEMYEYTKGIKTGFTNLAGACFLGAAEKDNLLLYASVLRASDESERFIDAQTLFEWTYSHIISYPVAHSDITTSMIESRTSSGISDSKSTSNSKANGTSASNEEDVNYIDVPVLAYVAHEDWIDKTVPATLQNQDAAVTIFDLNGNVSQSIEYESVSGNIHAGDHIATLHLYQRNTEIGTYNLVATEDVSAPNFFEGCGIWWDRLFRGFSGQATQAESYLVNTTPLVRNNA